jgi:DNA sulfur modification protein DndB
MASVAFEYVFPAIRGVQAGREYYVSMCPIRLIPRIFLFNEEEVGAEVRAQRTLNRARIPEIGRYILDNPTSYTFSALTASIDGEVSFEPMHKGSDAEDLGLLHIPMTARFLINDGQHRRAGIEEALKENPAIGDETIAIVFFKDVGLEQAQQMFADLNRHVVRATHSIGVLYDHRDEEAQLTRSMVQQVEIFRKLTDFERSSLAERSGKLFTLSSLHGATKSLLEGTDPNTTYEEKLAKAVSFWKAVCEHMHDWKLVAERRLSAGEIRRDQISCHSVALAALGRAGRTLLEAHPKDWKQRLKALNDLDWSRRNVRIWDGRALQGGQVSKSRAAVSLTTAYVKQLLNLPLTPEELRLEESLKATQGS